MRKYKFFFHFNKPASAAAKDILMSVHFRNKCYVVADLDCRVPSRLKKRKRQPVCVMEGYATTVDFQDGKATIR